ncbi:MAG: hypothetical protein K9G67_01285 [Bacteroidales bacterium]|nr:hypothetical protein [Bacteroidales bacterium]MCF8343813.1 hypothetical protein [Bacteroidales bacterium]MCF8350089.1 hypothetical protein [Bacteroidales bacterium]MCF8374967.1 hypothetical protein [Bacteroidales bacterium]MCF8402121.1 hypothetical protein [Bacteroidales bacterium]
MDQLNKEKFERMAAAEHPHCLSIFIPTHKYGMEVNERKDNINLKNQIKEAGEQLENWELKPREIDDFLKPLQNLLEDTGFWNNQQNGLALFRSKDHFEYIRSPHTLNEFVYISNHFYLKPLVPLLNTDFKFYILKIDLQDVHLYECTPGSIEKVDLGEDIPRNLKDVVGHDFEQKYLQFREGQTGFDKTMFHGHGEGKDDKKDEVVKFLRAVNDGVMNELHDKKETLLIASVDYIASYFNQISDYKNIHQEIINTRKQQHLSEVHQMGQQLLEDEFNKHKREQKAAFEQALSNNNASYQTDQIVPAAINGRIDTLFLNENEVIWGNYFRSTNSVKTDEKQTKNNAELTNLAAIQTVLNGGRSYIMKEDEMPESSTPMNAILRF